METRTDTRGTCKFSEKMEYGCSEPSCCELTVMVWVFLAGHGGKRHWRVTWSFRDVQICPQTMPTYVFNVHIYRCLPLSCSSLMITSKDTGYHLLLHCFCADMGEGYIASSSQGPVCGFGTLLGGTALR